MKYYTRVFFSSGRIFTAVLIEISGLFIHVVDDLFLLSKLRFFVKFIVVFS